MRPATVLARGLAAPLFFAHALAPSPRGRYVAVGEGARGLWLVGSDGAGLRQLLPAPRSADPSKRLAVGPVAWSPDRYRLAYAVNGADPTHGSAAVDATGIYLTRYDTPHPDLLLTMSQLDDYLTTALGSAQAGGPPIITRLSWSADGRTLAVSLLRPAVGDNVDPGQGIPLILSVDAATGKTRLLVNGGHDGAYSPTTGALAYISGGYDITSIGSASLRVADAAGRHGRVLARGALTGLSWSPDGAALAVIEDYMDGGAFVDTLDIATGRRRRVLTAPRHGAVSPSTFLSFFNVAWLPVKQ